MRSAGFERKVIERYGEASSRVPGTSTQIEAYRGVLPEFLLDLWQVEGFSGYGQGRLWLTNPAEFVGVPELWLQDTPIAGLDTFHVIARTGFGAMLVFAEASLAMFKIRSEQRWVIGSEQALQKRDHGPDRGLVIEPSFYSRLGRWDTDHVPVIGGNRVEGSSLFDDCREHLGPLTNTELYGFQESLTRPGKRAFERRSAEDAKKLDVIEHVSFLAGLGEPNYSTLDQPRPGAATAAELAAESRRMREQDDS